MSKTEAHTGKLVPIEVFGLTEEIRAESICTQFGFEKSEYHDSWIECLEDEGYRKVLRHNGIMYKVNNVEHDPDSFSTCNINSDGTIDYMMIYYNGGASFDEALEHAIDSNKDSLT